MTSAPWPRPLHDGLMAMRWPLDAERRSPAGAHWPVAWTRFHIGVPPTMAGRVACDVDGYASKRGPCKVAPCGRGCGSGLLTPGIGVTALYIMRAREAKA